MKKVIKMIIAFVFFIVLICCFTNSFGAEEIEIKITPNNTNLTSSDVMLLIDVSSTKIFDSSSYQSVQIILGDEAENNNWIDLGTGKNGIALKRSYSYIIKNNAKVTVRIAEWGKDDKTDLHVLASETYNVSNIDKTNPKVEKVNIETTTNSISLEIVANDDKSGISKYSCFCNEIAFSKVSENPKFDITNLEPNRNYNLVIIIEDKIGNKTTINQAVTTKAIETQNTEQQSTISIVDNENSVESTPQDNTIANKKIPDVGKKNFIVFIMIICNIIIIIKAFKYKNM